MAFESKHFTFNRKSDWGRGAGFQVEGDDALTPRPMGPGQMPRAVWFSPMLDSLESGTVWHRLRLEADLPEGAVIFARVYAADSPGMPDADGQIIPLDSILGDDGIPLVQKEQMFQGLAPQRVENPLDMPLFSVQGRYLWLMLELTGDGGRAPAVHSVKIEFPILPFTAYLPEVYRRGAPPDAFLNRLVAMLQAVYIDLEERIDTLPHLFSPATTSPDFLEWLAGWLSLRDSFIWEEERLRALLPELAELYRAKGTRRALTRVVELFLGQVPHIVEQAEAMQMSGGQGRALMSRLYGGSSRDFCVLVDAGAVPDRRTYSALGQIIESFAPAGTQPRLVGLKELFVLDDHVYLGNNTVLGMYKPFVLDGAVPIPMGTLELE